MRWDDCLLPKYSQALEVIRNEDKIEFIKRCKNIVK